MDMVPRRGRRRPTLVWAVMVCVCRHRVHKRGALHQTGHPFLSPMSTPPIHMPSPATGIVRMDHHQDPSCGGFRLFCSS